MSKQDRSNDGFYSKVIIAAIVVIWVSLVGGNWLGHYVVEKGVLGQSAKQEYRPATLQKPKPWISVDPSQQQELERLQGAEPSQATPAQPKESASPVAEAPVVTASPIDELASPTPAPEITPIVAPTPGAPTPTPTDVSSAATFHLQFGSFESRENAQAMVDNLQAVGQDAQVEEFKSESGKELFRVRGGAYTEEQARQQRDKLSEQQFKAFIVNSQ